MEFETLLQQPLIWFGAEGLTALAIQVFIVVTLALTVDLLQRRLLQRYDDLIGAEKDMWKQSIVTALQRPVTPFIWVIGITFAADIVAHRTEATIFDAVGPVRTLGVIVTLAWFLNRLISEVEVNLQLRATARNERLDRTTVDAVTKLLRISVTITAVLVALQSLGFSISGVLAFGGVGGIAVGFAAKDLLANFFGGLMVYLDRPFAVGDWIRSPDRKIEGTVEHIGWRRTTIRTFDKRPLYLPNSTFTTIAVENPSRMLHRRIHERVGLRYEDADKVAVIIEQVVEMLRGHPEIDSGQTLIVNLDTFAPSALEFFIYTFTHTTEWVKFHAIKQDVMLKVVAIVLANGAQFAYPTTRVHLSGSEVPVG